MYNLKLKDLREDYSKKNIVLDDVLDLYRKWVNEHHYMILYKINREKYLGFNNRIGKDTYEVDYLAVELSKRGNRVYLNRVRKRFRNINEILDLNKQNYFLNGKRAKSDLLFITLTYDIKKCGVDEAWHCLGKDLNDFLDRMRKKYGKITILRSFESYKNNYPHVHLIVGLKEKELPVVSYVSKKGDERYRLTNKYKNEIASFYHSYIKVEGVKSSYAVKYVEKYIVKDQREVDDYKSIAMCWFYGKRSYGLSRDFENFLSKKVELCIALLDTTMHNSDNNYDGFNFLCIVKANRDHDEIFFIINERIDFDVIENEVDYDSVFEDII